MRISDWSSDVCSSDLIVDQMAPQRQCGWRQYSGIAFDVQRLDRGMRRVLPVIIGAGKMRREEARLPRSSRRSNDATQGPADRKSTRLKSSHSCVYRMTSSPRKKKSIQQKRRYNN